METDQKYDRYERYLKRHRNTTAVSIFSGEELNLKELEEQGFTIAFDPQKIYRLPRSFQNRRQRPEF